MAVPGLDPGIVTAIHVFDLRQHVDAPDQPAHDGT
jgi:hypothetical protein